MKILSLKNKWKQKEEIKKLFMIQKIIFLNQKKIIISPQELVMLLVAGIEYKSNGDKDKSVSMKEPYLSTLDHS